MADISVTEKKRGNWTWLLAIVAIALVVALMVWLDRQEGTTSPVPVVEDDSTEAVVGDSVAPDGAVVGDSVAPAEAGVGDSVAQ